MNDQAASLWLTLRILLIAGPAVITFFESNHPQVSWSDVAIFSTCSIIVFGYLLLLKNKPNVDWTEPLSFTKPFFPLTKYPMHFWLLASYALISSGIGATLNEFKLHQSFSAFSGMYIFSGLSILLILLLFWFSPLNSDNRK